jgi:hypothetical protein
MFTNFVDLVDSIRRDGGVFIDRSHAKVNQPMTESSQEAAATVDGLPVDTSVKYNVNAGHCDQCGQFKTWDFKVKNEKSGKMMPGHVTAEGYKIGSGECPHWARIATMNKKRGERKGAGVAPGPSASPPPPGQWIQDIMGSTAASIVQSSVVASPSSPPVPAPAPAATPAPAPSVLGTEPQPIITFSVNGIQVSTSIAQAMTVVEQIVAAMRKLVLKGA